MQLKLRAQGSFHKFAASLWHVSPENGISGINQTSTWPQTWNQPACRVGEEQSKGIRYIIPTSGWHTYRACHIMEGQGGGQSGGNGWYLCYTADFFSLKALLVPSVTFLLKTISWFPNAYRVKFKFLCMAFRTLSNLDPFYQAWLIFCHKCIILLISLLLLHLHDFAQARYWTRNPIQAPNLFSAWWNPIQSI